MHTRPLVIQDYIEKMFNKNIEIGFQSADFRCVSAIFAKSSILSSNRCYEVVKIIRLLSFSK